MVKTPDDTGGAPPSYSSALTINRLRLSVHLGCEKEERVTPQPVEVSIRFYYPAIPAPALRDEGEYECYDKISASIRRMCANKEFRLIEFLCMQVYEVARKAVKKDVKIWVSLTKCNLPVPEVLNGASYLYTDLPPGAWTVPV